MNDIRQKFWTEVYIAYLAKSFAPDAAVIADEALRAFDERFSTGQTPEKPHEPITN